MGVRRGDRPLAALISSLVLLIAAFGLTTGVEAATVTIHITDRVSPASVSVPPNTTVTFVNDDGDRHRMRTTAGPDEFDSGNLESGQQFSVVLSAAGTYRYIDDRNDELTAYHGMITVSTTATTVTTVAPGTPTTTPTAPTTVTVSIGDRVYVPASVTVAAGGTVRFVNNDDRPHTVTADDRSFDSGIMDAGASWTRTFPTAGTFSYFCELHPDMRGSVTVSGGGGGTPPPTTAPTTPAPTTTAAPPTTTTAPPGTPTASVTISGNRFQPSALTVTVGTRVTWTNAEAMPHTVTAKGGAFDSGIMRQGDTFSWTFTSTGTFGYLCSLHPEMVGSVTVVPAGTPVPTTAAPPPPPPPATTAPPPSTGGGTPTTAPPSQPGAPAPSNATVAISGNRYSPGAITIAVGGTVTWRNDDAVPHTVTADNRSFDSGIMMQGDTWSKTFATTGTFSYFCEIHPEMKGTVTVVPAGTVVSPTATSSSTSGSGSGGIGSSTTPRTPSGSGGSGGSRGSGGSGSLATNASVVISGNQFSPGTITIAVGGTVTWRNDDAVPHTVTADDRSFDSGIMMQGDTWSKTFSSPGTYTYFCELHPAMTARVVVTTPGATSQPVVTGGSAGGTSSSTAGGSGAGVAAPGSGSVTMGNNQFDPSLIEIGTGGSVTWTNTDTMPHTVTAADGSFDSGIMMPGDTFSHTFSVAGEVAYSCTIHPGMDGTVRVIDGLVGDSTAGAATSAHSAGHDTAASAEIAALPVPDEVVISITDESFPAVTVVSVGQQVTWVNDDDVEHDVNARDGSFASGILRPGDSFTHRFETVGAAPYHSELHEHMRGIIIVVEADDVDPSTNPVVEVMDNGFEPADLVVHQGATVRWVFGGVLPHTVTADDGSFDSGILEPGASFTFEFDELGTFRYTCILHPAMIGTVTVVTPETEIPTDASGIAALTDAPPSGGSGSDTAAAEVVDGGGSRAPYIIAGMLAGLALALALGFGYAIFAGLRQRPETAVV